MTSQWHFAWSSLEHLVTQPHRHRRGRRVAPLHDVSCRRRRRSGRLTGHHGGGTGNTGTNKSVVEPTVTGSSTVSGRDRGVAGGAPAHESRSITRYSRWASVPAKPTEKNTAIPSAGRATTPARSAPSETSRDAAPVPTSTLGGS